MFYNFLNFLILKNTQKIFWVSFGSRMKELYNFISHNSLE